MQLSFKHQKVIKDFVLIDYLFVVFDLDQRHVVVKSNAFVGTSADEVASKVEFVLSLVRDLNPLIGHVLIAEPVPCVVAQIHVVSEDIEALCEGLLAFSALLFLLAGFEVIMKRMTFVLEYFELVFEFFDVKVLRVFHASGLFFPTVGVILARNDVLLITGIVLQLPLGSIGRLLSFFLPASLVSSFLESSSPFLLLHLFLLLRHSPLLLGFSSLSILLLDFFKHFKHDVVNFLLEQ